MLDITNEEFLLLKDYLFKTCGIEVPEEKSYLFRTRLYDLIEEEKLSSFYELYETLKSENNGKFEKRIIEVMTTHETAFFRDTHPFETFKNVLLPGMFTRIRSRSSLRVHGLAIWSAGCSTGQEAYSIAMIAKQVLETIPDFSSDLVRILATDISQDALTKAKSGEYSQRDIERGLDDYYRETFFKKKNNTWIIDPQIRNMVTFDEINLSKPLPDSTGPFDFIFCRNVIIYFSIELKKRLIQHFVDILNPGGILLIGASENLYKLSNKFKTHYSGQTIYYRIDE